MTSGGQWVLLDSLQFVNNISLSLKVDTPLSLVLRRLFTAILGKMMRYASCSHGLHLLSNTVSCQGEQVGVFEIHHLYVDEGTQTYLDSALEQRQPWRSGSHLDESGLPQYVGLQAEGSSGQGLQTILFELLMKDCLPCFPAINKRTQWQQLLDVLNNKRSSEGAGHMHEAQPPIICNASHLLVIPLSNSSRKLPNGNLGTLLLWNNHTKDDRPLWNNLEERLVLVSKIFTGFLWQLLRVRYGIGDETYLPSYRISGERSVIILFAGIRNFASATEIARNFNLIPELTDFMRNYHQSMCEIVLGHRGRVHNLIGDGIMAVFGEHEPEEEAAEASVEAALQMCYRFDVLKEKFFSHDRVRTFVLREYEPMDFQLSIGINLGRVIFDYFGAAGGRVYAPLGDHVNFAQRLELEASQYDARLGGVRAPILLSRPVWLKSGWGSKAKRLWLQLPGKSYEYEAYQCWPHEA